MAAEIVKIVVRVGGRELELTPEEARDLHRALGALVDAPAPITVREVVAIPAPQPWVPNPPAQPWAPTPVVPIWTQPPSITLPYIGDPPGWWQSPNTCVVSLCN